MLFQLVRFVQNGISGVETTPVAVCFGQKKKSCMFCAPVFFFFIFAKNFCQNKRSGWVTWANFCATGSLHIYASEIFSSCASRKTVQVEKSFQLWVNMTSDECEYYLRQCFESSWDSVLNLTLTSIWANDKDRKFIMPPCITYFSCWSKFQLKYDIVSKKEHIEVLFLLKYIMTLYFTWNIVILQK